MFAQKLASEPAQPTARRTASSAWPRPQRDRIFEPGRPPAPESRSSDFGSVPLRSGVPPPSGLTRLVGEADELGPEPVSQGNHGPGNPKETGLAVPTYRVTPTSDPSKKAPPVVPALVSRTLASAPDGTADSRQTVGVNETVFMICNVEAAWTASDGGLDKAQGAVVLWTAPAAGASCTITATPPTGTPLAAAMTVIPPKSRLLTNPVARTYASDKSGSGFVALVQIQPINVSFSGIEIREGAVKGVATGYHKDVLHWHGLPHPPTKKWLPVNAANGGMEDKVGTNEPGGPGPFKEGTFVWSIPQSYRIAGSKTAGTKFSTGTHVQKMTDSTGTETTSKEGATVPARTPGPPAAHR